MQRICASAISFYDATCYTMDCINYGSFNKENIALYLWHKKKFDSQPPSCSPLMRAEAEECIEYGIKVGETA